MACSTFSSSFKSDVQVKAAAPPLLAAIVCLGDLMCCCVHHRTKECTRSLSRHLLAVSYLVLVPAVETSLEALSCEVSRNNGAREASQICSGGPSICYSWTRLAASEVNAVICCRHFIRLAACLRQPRLRHLACSPLVSPSMTAANCCGQTTASIVRRTITPCTACWHS